MNFESQREQPEGGLPFGWHQDSGYVVGNGGPADLVGWTDASGAVTLEAPAGSIVAFSSLSLHATGANRTDKLRRVYLAQYTREVMLNPGTRQLRNNAVPLLLKGEIATVA